MRFFPVFYFVFFHVCFYIFHLAKLLLALDTLIVIPVNLNVFVFYIFHLAKLLLALDTLIVIPVNLNVYLIKVRTIALHYYGTYRLISLLNLPNSATTILYHSSLPLSFSPVKWWSTWCHNTMAFLSLQAWLLHTLIL